MNDAYGGTPLKNLEQLVQQQQREEIAALTQQLTRTEQSLKDCLRDECGSSEGTPAWGDMLHYLNHQAPFPAEVYQMVKNAAVLWGRLRIRLNDLEKQ